MIDREILKPVFEPLAVDNCIGNPNGKLAYAYIRVSSKGQAEEGKTGLPRQIERIHEVAKDKGYKIPWDLVFADDHTGFEFEDRPELKRLRMEYTSYRRRANAIVMEYLDRLSRNADWHQGYLLDEMKKCGLEVIFWKAFSSRIERAVLGAISQEGMEYDLKKMADGNLIKAQTHKRVTARTSAYGFKFVDSQGKEGLAAKKDTHYALNHEAPVVKYIYEQIGIEGVSLRKLSSDLEGKYPPPKNMAHWEQKILALIIRNPVYKGEFVAHRWQEIKVRVENKDGLIQLPPKTVKRKIERPREEWIIVPVPPIVSTELWELANRVLDKNFQMGRRNAKEPYLLTGVVKCNKCKHTYIGGRKTKKGRNGQEYRLSYYRCTARSHRAPHVIREIGCDQSQISCRILDDSVWSVICQVLLDPQILTGALDRCYTSQHNDEYMNEVEFLEEQILDKDREDEKLYRAYQADVFDEEEYALKRRALKESRQKILDELEKKHGQVMTRDQYEERKRIILAICKSAANRGVALDAPFELKQRTIKTIVDKITLNVNEGWFRMEGVINGEFQIMAGRDEEMNGGEPLSQKNGYTDGLPEQEINEIMCIPVGRGSWLRSVCNGHNWPGILSFALKVELNHS